MNSTVLPVAQHSKAFRFFLLLSITIHVGALLYKEKTLVFAPPATSSPSPALQVRIQQQVAKPRHQERHQEKLKEKPKEKPIPPKKTPQPQKEVAKKELQKKAISSAPRPVAFNNAIKNYVEPHYPRLAIRRGITGTVKLSLIILGNGHVKDVLISKSSGHHLLDSSVLDAAKQWVFNSLSKNPKSLYKISKTLVFKLN